MPITRIGGKPIESCTNLDCPSTQWKKLETEVYTALTFPTRYPVTLRTAGFLSGDWNIGFTCETCIATKSVGVRGFSVLLYGNTLSRGVFKHLSVDGCGESRSIQSRRLWILTEMKSALSFWMARKPKLRSRRDPVPPRRGCLGQLGFQRVVKWALRTATGRGKRLSSSRVGCPALVLCRCLLHEAYRGWGYAR